MAKNYIKLYFDDLDALAGLTSGEVGRLVTAVLEYARDGKEADLGGSERILYPMFKMRVDREKVAYQKNAEIRAEAGRQGGRPKAEEKQKKANESKKKQMLSEKANESKKSYTNSQYPIANSQYPLSNNLDTPYNPPQGDAFADFAGENQILYEALRAFEESRKKNRKPMTPRAKELLVGELVKSPEEDWITMLENATLHGWQSVYPLKPEEKKQEQPKEPVLSYGQMSADRFKRLREQEAKKWQG